MCINKKINIVIEIYLDGETSTSGMTLNGNENRRGKPPPDRHEIYHIKMPEGNTARTREIMQNASMMRRHGLSHFSCFLVCRLIGVESCHSAGLHLHKKVVLSSTLPVSAVGFEFRLFCTNFRVMRCS